MEKGFEESFEQIYDQIYTESANKLKEVNSKNNMFILGITLVLIIINVIVLLVPNTQSMFVLSLSISVIVFILFCVIGRNSYKKIYKAVVINSLVKGYNENIYYDAKAGISRAEYDMSQFDKGYDEFYSEDKIYGTFENGENFQMAEVVTEDVNRYRDADGNEKIERTLIFKGLFGKVNLINNISSRVYIVSNSGFRKFSKKRVEIDSSEFEEYYDCITDDKVKAMRIFTADLIEKYIEIVKDNKNGFELKIEDNNLFFRYKCGNVFEPPTFKSGLDKEFVKKYYKLIYYPLEIIKSTIENIREL